MDTEQALTSLLDVAGVEGSFLVSQHGDLAAWNMPSTFDEGVLDEVSAKLHRFRDAFTIAGESLDGCIVRFSGHRLCLKVGHVGMLCVLARHDVNMAALRMASRLILSRLGAPARD
jgi:predicted regulator of Ras-like GTPase activity (Roadblock/LC7/MglB family)